jgi:ABC-2 type transport system ATP-binding protein
MIEVQGLTKRYGNIHALNDVSFSVQKGQIVGFLGANGAGKTTTMDILCGCIGADQGSAQISGYDITSQPNEAKRRLGYLPDEPPLYTDMLVKEYIEYSAKLHKVPRTEIKKRVDETVEKLSLGEVRNRLVGNLSKGFRQRVGLAQAIVHDPEVLVLDEPTEGLDPNQIVHIRELIRSLAGQHTIILSSHILSEVQNTCDHIIIINKGRIVKQGTYDELVKVIGKTRQYFISVDKHGKSLADKISGFKGVSDVHVSDTDGHRVEFTMDGSEGIIDSIARAAMDGSHGIKEIASKTKTLEEIFFQLTR